MSPFTCCLHCDAKANTLGRPLGRIVGSPTCKNLQESSSRWVMPSTGWVPQATTIRSAPLTAAQRMCSSLSGLTGPAWAHRADGSRDRSANRLTTSRALSSRMAKARQRRIVASSVAVEAGEDLSVEKCQRMEKKLPGRAGR
jgi:hypothetical protein